MIYLSELQQTANSPVTTDSKIFEYKFFQKGSRKKMLLGVEYLSILILYFSRILNIIPLQIIAIYLIN